MAKIKLKKPGNTRTSKNIPVEDKDGNKHILKATIVSVRKGTTAEIQDDAFSSLGLGNDIVKPPLNQGELAVLSEFSSELEQVVDSMAIGIHGFGGRLKPRTMTEEQKKKHKAEIIEEKLWLDALIHFPNPKQTWRKLMKTTRKDLEKTGNAYWELIRSRTHPDRYSCINKLKISRMFIGKMDKKFTRMKKTYIGADLKIHTKPFNNKFRKIINMVRNKKAYFKEFGDPRVMDRRTGKIIAASPKQWAELAQANENNYARRFPKKIWANEVYHFRLETSRETPYGMPRFTGNIIAIKGSRSADETNIITQQNNHVPSMVISVAGGQLTEGSVVRLQEFIDTQIKGDSNYSKFLILEGESNHDGLSAAGSLKIDVKPLSNNQVSDQLWQSYDENNASKVRRSFRLAPIMVGEVKDLNRATAQESERLAEKWVYNPEREDFDDEINQIIMSQGLRFWWWKTNSPNVTNDQDIVKLLVGSEKTGGMTPRIARLFLEDVMGHDLPPIKENDPDFDPDLPFSLSLAKLVGGMAEANRAGTFSPQGQIPKPPGPNGRPRNPENSAGTPNGKLRQMPVELLGRVMDSIDMDDFLKDLISKPDKALETLCFVRDRLEDGLDSESFGKPEGDYFDSGH